jgi:prepilin-type N-terminal cleavage/methylation domain-containing protein
MKKVLAQGFTLVELLIVIALLGIIATIVIATINPIEQANKARDAGYKNDASELVSAVQRYYASQNQFPWTTLDPGTYPNADSPFGWVSADDGSVGLCPKTGNCQVASPAPLIASYELATSFLNKSWIGSSVAGADKLYIGKAGGASSSVYVCWVPKSSANRQNLINSCATNSTTSCKMMNLTKDFTASGTPATSNVCTSPNDLAWSPSQGSLPQCAECVPE